MATGQPKSWKDRRTTDIRWLRLILVVAIGLAFYGASSFLPAALTQKTIENATGSPLGTVVSLLLTLVHQKQGALAAIVTALVVGVVVTKTGPRWLYDRAFQRYNDDVLTRIPQPKALDPLRGAGVTGVADLDGGTPWIEPETGPRAQAWAALWSMVPPVAGGKAAPKFSWSLVTGRAGSGKSRMALEFAGLLAREDGFTAPLQRSNAQRIAFLLRRELPHLFQHVRIPTRAAREPEHDPWDAGWLKPPHQAGAGRHADEAENRRAAPGAWLNALGEWRPRRPTILLLDDPYDHTARDVIARLETGAEQFRFAVILLVINPTVPQDLAGSLQTGGPREIPFGGMFAPVILSDDARFSRDEVRHLAARMNLPAKSWRGSDADVDALSTRTEGSPLLLELACSWLRLGRPMHEITRPGLLRHRAERIQHGLAAAGLGGNQHAWLFATTTILGGLPEPDRTRRTVLKDPQTDPRGFLLDAMGLQSVPKEALDLAFPDEAGNFARFIPGIRPELVGDAFVEYAIGLEDPYGTACRIADAAWRLSPQAALRAARRLSLREHPLTASLSQPPESLFTGDGAPARIDIGFALAETAIRIPREEWDAGSWTVDATFLADVVAWLATVEPQDAARAMSRWRALLRIDDAVAVVRPDPAIRCYASLLGRALAAADLAADEQLQFDLLSSFFALLDCLARREVSSRAIDALLPLVPALAASCVAAPRSLALVRTASVRLLRSAGWAPGLGTLLAHLLGAIPRQDGEDPDRAVVNALTAEAWRDVDALRAMTDAIDVQAIAATRDVATAAAASEILGCRCFVLRELDAQDELAAIAERHAALLAAFDAEPWAAEARILTIRDRFRRDLLEASYGPEHAAIAESVETIAAPFPGEARVQDALIWFWSSFCEMQDGVSLAVARQIADRFAELRRVRPSDPLALLGHARALVGVAAAGMRNGQEEAWNDAADALLAMLHQEPGNDRLRCMTAAALAEPLWIRRDERTEADRRSSYDRLKTVAAPLHDHAIPAGLLANVLFDLAQWCETKGRSSELRHYAEELAQLGDAHAAEAELAALGAGGLLILMRERAEQKDLVACRTLAQRVRRCSEAHPDSQRLRVALATSLRVLIGASGAGFGSDLLGELEALLAADPARGVRLEAAHGWLHVLATAELRQDAERARQVVANVLRCAGDEDGETFAFLRTQAWHQFAHVAERTNDVASCRDAVAKATAEAAAFLGTSSFDFRREVDCATRTLRGLENPTAAAGVSLQWTQRGP